MAHEIWRTIAGTHGRYEASSHARVRATSASHMGRQRPDRDADAGGLLRPYPAERGYQKVRLELGGRSVQWTVGACVLRAFVGPPSRKHRATYLDGNRDNADLSNLAWLDAKGNKDVANALGHSRRRPAKRVAGVVHYLCGRCTRWLPAREFYKLKGGLSRLGNPLTRCGKHSECRRCNNHRRVEYRQRYGDGGAPSRLEKVLPLLELLDGAAVPIDELTPSRCGERIAAVRKHRGLSRKEVAWRAKLKPETVDKVERGVNVPREATLKKIIAALTAAVDPAPVASA